LIITQTQNSIETCIHAQGEKIIMKRAGKA